MALTAWSVWLRGVKVRSTPISRMSMSFQNPLPSPWAELALCLQCPWLMRMFKAYGETHYRARVVPATPHP